MWWHFFFSIIACGRTISSRCRARCNYSYVPLRESWWNSTSLWTRSGWFYVSNLKLMKSTGEVRNKWWRHYCPVWTRVENRSKTNIISADYYSLAYSRTPEEIARIVYTTGNEHIPGGIYPHGANGRIAREFLKDPWKMKITRSLC